ncbi:hypothetical protein [Frisingicoccus sp.]|uniref:hypothetical protein n=1 Tax=Frisingicoccus sp. TaxID=1918627 RepID=UPI002EC659BE|nr:hypothetical protein [Frisingicoccus sp.]
MKRKCICLFLWLLLIGLSFGGGYLCFAWPLSYSIAGDVPDVLPVTAGKKNFIVPGTRLVTETINLKTGEKTVEETPMPSDYLGLEREDLLSELNDYMIDMPIKEREQGLVGFDIESYSKESVVLRKTYYPDENFKKYYMVYKQGRIVVYYSDRKTVLEYPDVKFYNLPSEVQCQLLSGIEVKDEEELYNFLQNYSS